MAVKIYRKESVNKPVSKMAKGKTDEAIRIIGLRSRVSRPSLLAFFTPRPNGKSEFHSMTAIPASIIDNRAERIINHSDKGWVIPSDSLGRPGTANPSDSILLWIKQHIVGAGFCSADEVSIVVEDDE